MNKITYALTLGAGLVLSLAGPSADAAPMLQNLATPEMPASQFNTLFQQIPGVNAMSSPYQFMNNAGPDGSVLSQAFEGKGAAAGVYAYAYQFGVNNVSDSTGQATSVNSASMVFNATPTPANLMNGAASAVYMVKDGPIITGNNLPQAPGTVLQAPTSLAWLPEKKTGSLTFQYLDAASNTSPILAGNNSATLVVLSTQPPVTQPVSLQNPDPQTVYPTAYSPQNSAIQQIPAPEPATVLAWAGMVGAMALARRVRRSRASA